VNVRLADYREIMAALKERETLRLRTAAGEVTSAHSELQPDFRADAVATARRQRLTEIASWFDPHSNATTRGQGTAGQDSDVPDDDMLLNGYSSTTWIVERTAIITAVVLFTLCFDWLISRVVDSLSRLPDFT
jgi:hypothetical protein